MLILPVLHSESVETISTEDISELPNAYKEVVLQSANQPVLRKVQIATGGVVGGFENLATGNRYYLAPLDDVSAEDLAGTSQTDEIDQLLAAAEELLSEDMDVSSSSASTTNEEVDVLSITPKTSRAITAQKPYKKYNMVQILGLAQSNTELLLMPSLDYKRNDVNYQPTDEPVVDTPIIIIDNSSSNTPQPADDIDLDDSFDDLIDSIQDLIDSEPIDGDTGSTSASSSEDVIEDDLTDSDLPVEDEAVDETPIDDGEVIEIPEYLIEDEIIIETPIEDEVVDETPVDDEVIIEAPVEDEVIAETPVDLPSEGTQE